MIIGFGLKIKRGDKNLAGDIEVLTKDEIIEVKASISSVDDVQLDKMIDVNHVDFMNPEQKKVILYIDEPLTPDDHKKLENIKSKGVTIVNSLDELKEVLK